MTGEGKLMPKPKVVDGWMVRVVMRGGGMLHFVSETEPDLFTSGGSVTNVGWQPTEDGDTPDYIDWSEVVAITWRDAHGE